MPMYNFGNRDVIRVKIHIGRNSAGNLFNNIATESFNSSGSTDKTITIVLNKVIVQTAKILRFAVR